MNNKGFAITGIIYGLMLLFILILVSFLSIIVGKNRKIDDLAIGVYDSIDYKEEDIDLNNQEEEGIYTTKNRGLYSIKTCDIERKKKITCNAYLPKNTVVINSDVKNNNEYSFYYKIDGGSDLGEYKNLTCLKITEEDDTSCSKEDDQVEANSPDLVQGLIPVYYDGSNWKTTDSNNTDNKWYDYDNKKWANAILVDSSVRTTYKNSETTVNMSKVLAFYVWIPRYKYKVWNINKVMGTDSYDAYHTGIDIRWEKDTESTGTISCTYDFSKEPSLTVRNEDCTGSNGDYYTHPAFTFGNDELRGIWVGKFEVSSSSPTATNGGGTSITLTPRILPGVISWRSNPVDNQWKVIYDMQKSSNIYGLSTSRTNTDSHMMTNMEWGAVAYLTNSKYGRCTDNVCTEVSNNNSSDRYTGKSAGLASVTSTSSAGTYTYETTNGGLASTTGNIYGIYDMRGGSYEYVMGNVGNSGTTYMYNASNAGSNYTYTGYEKYLTTYKYGGPAWEVETTYNRGRLGDAMDEVVVKNNNGWYDDAAYPPYSDYSWALRGANYNGGKAAGIFSVNSNPGDGYGSVSSRAILAKIN